MRAGFGLLSLLIVVALVFYLSFGTKSHPGYDATVLESGKKAQQAAQQIAGRTEDNTPISETIELEAVDSDGKPNGQYRRLKVISVKPETPMDTVYGLKAGDQIIRVGDMGVSDIDDPGMGKALVYDSYARNQPLVVLRDDQQITLTPTNSPMSKFGGAGLMKGVTVPSP